MTSESAGRIRIRCMGATNLPLREAGLFQWRNSAAYAVLQLHDGKDNMQSPERKTRQIPRTANPQWREEFCFSLRGQPQELMLNVAVWNYNSWKDADLLGQTQLTLDQKFMLEAAQQRQTRELELEGVRSPKKGPTSLIKLEVSWEPARIIGSHVAGKRVWTVVHSPQALRVFRVGLLGSAAGLLVVARNARWLCEGTAFATCHALPVPGAVTCATLAALAVSLSTLINFAGSAGFLGPTWSGEPLSVLDLVTEVGEKEAEDGTADEPTMRMQVQSVGMLQWNVSMATSLLPKIGDALIAIRLLTMFAHLTAAALSALALALTCLGHGQSSFFGEASYLVVGAFNCLALSALTSLRERKLLAQADREKWSVQVTPKTNSNWMHGDVSPSFVKQLMTGRDSLAQPLLEAQQRLSEKMEDEVARPIRERLQAMQNAGHPMPDWMLPLFNQLAHGPGGPHAVASSSAAGALGAAETGTAPDLSVTTPSTAESSAFRHPPAMMPAGVLESFLHGGRSLGGNRSTDVAALRRVANPGLASGSQVLQQEQPVDSDQTELEPQVAMESPHMLPRGFGCCRC